MRIVVETERLILREFIPEDAPRLFEINNDPEVLKYTGDPPFKTVTEAQEFIKQYTPYKETGVGRYAVLRKQDKRYLGWCGLKYHPDRRVTDLGLRYYKNYWNLGYGTESALGVIKYAFENLKLPFLVAHTHIKNTRSQHVLDKCHFEKLSEIAYDNQPTYLYLLKNPDYTLKEVKAIDTWPVRHPVLRAGRPLEDVYMEADEKETTFHIGMYYKNEIVGVASFMEDVHTQFSGAQTRLRGMAVLPSFRKKGIAELLLHKGEAILKEKKKDVLWFNARIAAIKFYKNLGYTTIGNQFMIPKIGPHYLMKKEL